MPGSYRALTVLGAVLTCTFTTGPTSTLAVQPHPCTRADQRAIVTVVSTFSRALIRTDLATVNRLITPALRAQTRAKWVRGVRNPKTEQASLSLMLFGPDYNGTPARPLSFRFLPNRLECYGVKPLGATMTLFYRWPGEALSNVGLVRTAKGWRISGLALAEV